jgi:hypothetical protein
MKPHRKPSWIFFLSSAIFGLLFAFLFKSGEMWPSWLGTVHIFIYTFTPATFIHLALNFPGERDLIKKYPYVQFLPYLASLLLFLRIRLATPEMMGAPRIWLIALMSYLALSVLTLLISCLHLWLTSPSEIVKLRSKMILLGVAISASVPLLETVVNTLFHVFIVPSFNYYLPFCIVFPLFVGYSIIKHNLFDIDAAIRRTFGYILVTIGIAIIYTLSIFIPSFLFSGFKAAESAVFPLVFTLIIVFFFNLARGQIQKLIDRVFYRLEYDYQETVQKIGETMRSLLTLDQIGESMMEIASNVLFIEKGWVMLLNPRELHRLQS